VHQRLGECVLDCFLGELDVAEKADQDRDRAAVLAAKNRCDFRFQ
jgi:hypothetical protein